ncbi:hypothetical protein DACRYDRAFT_117131 [Dacryopinax primogenitus]|uniref:BTB domain-containing protein n=1 Tax=Dacryopinax primogenitus (strain DJM 731) TaxID=1858805 RepID=M5G4F7_DACPD|nr:uncharacterized protein DACRYDRAFT_117131 [Dacryopinax primogenitus]EJU00692.1 hypothetical protein DACRYDRAFT_117131 [Dacryopinax primogenitus]
MSRNDEDDVDMDARPNRNNDRSHDPPRQAPYPSYGFIPTTMGDQARRGADDETEVERAISVEKGKGRVDSNALTWYLPDRLRGQSLQSVIERLQKNAHLFWRNEANANMVLVIPSPGSGKRQPSQPIPRASNNRRPSPPREPYRQFPPDPRMSPYWGPPAPYGYPYWPPQPMYPYGPPMREYDYPPREHHRPPMHRRDRRSPSPDSARYSPSEPTFPQKKELRRKRPSQEDSPEPAPASPERERDRERSDSVPPAFPSLSSGGSPTKSRESPYALKPDFTPYPPSPYPGDYWAPYPPPGPSGSRRPSTPSDRPRRADDDKVEDESITYHVHKEYLLTQCALIRYLYSSLDKTGPPTKDLPNPTAAYRFLPRPADPFQLSLSNAANPRIHIDLPDPDSFPQILEWMYFGPAALPHLEEAMREGRVTWGGLVRNAEWLGINEEFKNWLGRHWKLSMEEGKLERDIGNKVIPAAAAAAAGAGAPSGMSTRSASARARAKREE